MSIEASLILYKALTRDITQANRKPKYLLDRYAYMSALEEFLLGEQGVLHVFKQLHGIHESELHWFLTYLEHHVYRLQMHHTRKEPCLLYDKADGRLK